MNDKVKIEKIKQWMITDAPKVPYHNSDHGLDVWKVVKEYVKKAGVPYNNQLSLEFAALNHDLIYIPGAKDNEEQSAKLNAERLYGLKVPYDIIKESSGLILATKVPVSPKSFLEKIICDADVDNFGREDFLEKGTLIRQEIAMTGKTFTDLEWYKISLGLLENHQYYTEMAKEKRDEGKARNISKLKDLIHSYKSLA